MIGLKRKYRCMIDTIGYSDDSNKRVMRELESLKGIGRRCFDIECLTEGGSGGNMHQETMG